MQDIPQTARRVLVTSALHNANGSLLGCYLLAHD